jgi:hypothetical protein
MRLRLPVIVTATIFALAGCTAAPGVAVAPAGTTAAPASQPLSPPTPSPSAPPLASPSAPPLAPPSVHPPNAGPRPCATANLSMSIPGSSSAMFEEGGVLVLTNKGATSCTLSGYPDIQFVGASGDLPTTETRQAGTVATVTLRPGASATALLVWNKYEGQGTTCPPFPVAVKVTPPGQGTAARIPWITEDLARSVCGGKITVFPIAASN